MIKVGISGQPLNAKGKSPRANPQVAAFKKKGIKARAVIIETNLRRREALALEQKITDKHAARNKGNMPSDYHRRPKPLVDNIADYFYLYGEPVNTSTGGRY